MSDVPLNTVVPPPKRASDTLVPLLSLACMGALCFRMYTLEMRVIELESKQSLPTASDDDRRSSHTFAPIHKPRPSSRRSDEPVRHPPDTTEEEEEEQHYDEADDMNDIDEGLPPNDPANNKSDSLQEENVSDEE